MPTVVLQPSAASGIDTDLNGSGADVGKNYGVGTSMIVGNNGAWQKGLLKFDLSSIPANTYVVSATLTLVSGTTFGTPSISLYRSLVQWFEGTKNGAAPSAGEDGSTWNHRNANGSVTWVGGAGGGSGSDYASVATDSVTVNTTGPFDWDVTVDVRGFIDGTYTNHGWFIVTPNVVSTLAAFITSDNATAGNRPQLSVEYEFISDLTLNPSADTYIAEANPTFNYGQAIELKVGADASNLLLRGMAKFDLADIPSDAIVISAKLRVYCDSELNSTDRLLSIYRFLVQWYEGVSNGAAPGGGVDATTWNYRNANGSIAWTSGAGGGSAGNGVESANPVTGTVNITSAGSYFEVDVKSDVQNFVSGAYTNYGWWLRGIALANSAKIYNSKENTAPATKPELVISFASSTVLINSAITGSTTVSASLSASGLIEAAISGLTTISANLLTNEFIATVIVGSTSLSGDIVGVKYLHTAISGSSGLTGHLQSQIFISPALIESETLISAHLTGVYQMSSLIEGSSILSADPSFQGQVRAEISGSTDVTATGYAKALHVATIIGCNPVPLLYITDGSVKSNGQLNLLNLISERNGYRLKNWKPVISQYKDGGRFSSSPLSQGRRLRSRSFDNVIEVFDLSAVDHTQDALIQYQQDLIAFQEAAADYWVSDFVVFPIYLVARAARETNTRYAIIHLMSIPELENPYQQPFFDSKQAAMETITLRVERGHWTATPPGKTECVAISSQRSWTIGGWQTGS